MSNNKEIVLDTLNIGLPVQVWKVINQLLQANYSMLQIRPIISVIEEELAKYEEHKLNPPTPIKEPKIEEEEKQPAPVEDYPEGYITERVKELLEEVEKEETTGYLEELTTLLKELRRRDHERNQTYYELDTEFEDKFGFSVDLADETLKRKEIEQDTKEFLKRNEEELESPYTPPSDPGELIEKLNDEVSDRYGQRMYYQGEELRHRTEYPTWNGDTSNDLDINTYKEMMAASTTNIKEFIKQENLGDNSEYLEQLEEEESIKQEAKELKMMIENIRDYKS